MTLPRYNFVSAQSDYTGYTRDVADMYATRFCILTTSYAICIKILFLWQRIENFIWYVNEPYLYKNFKNVHSVTGTLDRTM